MNHLSRCDAEALTLIKKQEFQPQLGLPSLNRANNHVLLKPIMKYVTRRNVQLGDKVLIPLNNEWLKDEQIMLEHEVILAFKCSVHPDEQVVGEGQEPLPLIREFHDDIAMYP